MPRRRRAGGDAGDGEADNDGEADAYCVRALARCVPLDAVDACEVKAVTFSEAVVEARDGEWYACVVFDV